MDPRRFRLCLLLVAISAVLIGSSAAQAPDDPFYDWDLERYRMLRSPDDPTGGILPLPDLPADRWHHELRSASVELEGADSEPEAAAPEQDGRRIRDGFRLYPVFDCAVALPLRLRAGIAGRFAVGDGGRSGGEWLERSLVWSNERLEARVGLTRSFWGDGSGGSLLLGRTAPPLEMIRLRSVRPWMIPYLGDLGRVHGSVFLAYLDDKYRVVAYPLLHGSRLEWEPVDWFRFSAARTIMLGGVGRTTKLTGSDLLDILLGRNENPPHGLSISNTDQKASFMWEARLPRRFNPFEWLTGVRLFYEYAGEDSFEGLLPTAVAHHWGGAVGLFDWIALFEAAETNDDANFWYSWHNVYRENAYYFRGYSIGHPMGGDKIDAHLRIWSPALHGVRVQTWARARGHWNRDTDKTDWWEESLGIRACHNVSESTLLDIGFEVRRSSGDLAPLPDPPVRWLFTAGLRSDLPFGRP